MSIEYTPESEWDERRMGIDASSMHHIPRQPYVSEFFPVNWAVEKTERQIRNDLYEVEVEITRRRLYGNDIEDQHWRQQYAYDGRGQHN
jgi:hypothetical protein